MNLSGLGRSLAGGLRASAEDTRFPLTSSVLLDHFGGKSVDSGVRVNRDTALSSTALFRAVALVAGTAGSIEIRCWAGTPTKRKDETTERHPIIADPHPEMTAFELKEYMFACIEMHGNAYFLKSSLGETARPDGTGRRKRWLFPISPTHVRVGRAKDGTKVFELNVDGELVPATTAEILHIPNISRDGLLGMSAIEQCAQAVGIALASEKHAAHFFGRGAMMSGILQTDRRLPPGAAEDLKQRWQRMSGGIQRAHEVAVLDQGAKFLPVSIPPEQAQLLETRRFSVVEFARMIGVPPHLLMETDRSTSWGSGIEEQTKGFILFSMASKLDRVAQRLSKELLPRGQFCRFDTATFLSTAHREWVSDDGTAAGDPADAGQPNAGEPTPAAQDGAGDAVE